MHHPSTRAAQAYSTNPRPSPLPPAIAPFPLPLPPSTIAPSARSPSNPPGNSPWGRSLTTLACTPGGRAIDTCSATTRSGTPCGFAARNETGLCVNHDPVYQQQQRQNLLKGAANSAAARRFRETALDGIFDLRFDDRASVQAAIDTVVRLQFSGQLPDRKARIILRALTLAVRNFDPPRFRPQRGHMSTHDPAAYTAARDIIDRHVRLLAQRTPPPEDN